MCYSYFAGVAPSYFLGGVVYYLQSITWSRFRLHEGLSFSTNTYARFSLYPFPYLQTDKPKLMALSILCRNTLKTEVINDKLTVEIPHWLIWHVQMMILKKI